MAFKAPRHERRRLARERWTLAMADEMERLGITHLMDDFEPRSSVQDMERVLRQYLTREEALAVVKLNDWYQSVSLPEDADRAPLAPDVPASTEGAVLAIMEGGTEGDREVCSYILFLVAHAEALRRIRS